MYVCCVVSAQVHRSSRLLSRHVSRPAPPVPATEVSSGGGDSGAALAESQCCPLHDGRPLEYYCTDDDVAVCSHCSISGEHKGHTVEPLSDRVSGHNRLVVGSVALCLLPAAS